MEEDTNGELLHGFDELEKAVAEEEKSRSFGFVEEPLTSQVRYDFRKSLNWLFASADLVEFARYLKHLFGVQPKGVQLQADEDARAALSRTVLKGQDLSFTNGALQYITDPTRITRIDDITTNENTVYVYLDGGTSAEARWVARKTIDLLLLSAGRSLSWLDLAGEIEYEAYATSTKAHLGINLIDFFSDRFKDFVQNDIAKQESFVTRLGTYPSDKKRREIDQAATIVTPIIHGLQMSFYGFNRIGGRSWGSDVRFDVVNKMDNGQGILTVRTELDSVLHTHLINQLRLAILDQVKS